MTKPPIPFPGPLPAGPITYGGVTHNYQNGVAFKFKLDGVTGQAKLVWRLFDYANQAIITDQEAFLLGVAPEFTQTEADLYARALADPYVAEAMTYLIGVMAASQQWPALDAANAALSAAQNQLAADTAAGAGSDVIAADNAAVATAQTNVNNVLAAIGTIEGQYTP